MTVLPGRYYNFHFTDEETSSKKLNHLTKVSCLEESSLTHSKTHSSWFTSSIQRNLSSKMNVFIQFSFVQSLSRVQLFVTPWTTAYQASLSITNSQSLLKLMSIESMMPSNHLILCHPLLLLPSIFCSIRVFSNESVLHIRWPKY